MPTIGEIDGKANDGEEKVHLLAPGFSVSIKDRLTGAGPRLWTGKVVVITIIFGIVALDGDLVEAKVANTVVRGH